MFTLPDIDSNARVTIPNADKFEERIKVLGIPYDKEYVPSDDNSGWLFNMESDEGLLTIAFSSGLIQGKEVFGIVSKWKEGPSKEGHLLDAQYVIDNIETIYNTMVI